MWLSSFHKVASNSNESEIKGRNKTHATKCQDDTVGQKVHGRAGGLIYADYIPKQAEEIDGVPGWVTFLFSTKNFGKDLFCWWFQSAFQGGCGRELTSLQTEGDP